MKVRATKWYEIRGITDNELKKIPKEGEIFEVTPKRYEQLINNIYGLRLIEPVKERKKEKENKIAIIIPNYNYSDWIEKCLKSRSEEHTSELQSQ